MTSRAYFIKLGSIVLFGSGHYLPSEANQVAGQFNRLNEIDKQHVLNFLCTL